MHDRLGTAPGGEAGALLRATLTQARAAAPAPTARMVGVDDYQWRRGHRCSTVLVDLKRNRVFELPPDRQADTPAARLEPRAEAVNR